MKIERLNFDDLALRMGGLTVGPYQSQAAPLTPLESP